MSKEKEITGLDLMRKEFLPNQISQLPKPTKKQTEDVKADYKKGVRCTICGTWHHPDVIHLSYVGHAALTDRLLDCDPAWSWEPLSLGTDGHPVIDKDGGMWIKLTVCGVTRLGYGDAQGKIGGDAMKERIGDALRNAAMRFGAALDLWHKGDLHITEPVDSPGQPLAENAPKTVANSQSTEKPPAASTDDEKYYERIRAALNSLFGNSEESKKAEIIKLTAFPNKDGKIIQGHPDYRKKTGKSLQILCHKLEDMAKCPTCKAFLINGVCQNEGNCPDAMPF